MSIETSSRRSDLALRHFASAIRFSGAAVPQNRSRTWSHDRIATSLESLKSSAHRYPDNERATRR